MGRSERHGRAGGELCQRGFQRRSLVGDYDTPGRIDPAVIVIEGAVGANGTDDRVGSRLGIGGSLDDAFESAAHGAAAQFDEARGDGVAADRTVGGQLEIVLDIGDREPVDVSLFDLFAILVLADDAFARVAVGCGGGLRDCCGLSGTLGRLIALSLLACFGICHGFIASFVRYGAAVAAQC